MTTVRDLLTDSMREIGAIAISEVPTDAEAQYCLGKLNRMLGTWQTETLMVYGRDEEVFILTAGQASYTIGAGADIDTERPNAIVDAYVRDTNNNDYKMWVTTNSEDYSDITSKTVTSTIPTLLYYNTGVPYGTIRLWPLLSDSSYRLVLWTWTILNEFSTINDVVVVPPGYERAIVSNLAVSIAAAFGREVMDTLGKEAISSKAQLKKYNMTVLTMGFPTGLEGTGLTFNYLTGSPT